jgi:hypothetical protein
VSLVSVSVSDSVSVNDDVLYFVLSDHCLCRVQHHCQQHHGQQHHGVTHCLCPCASQCGGGVSETVCLMSEVVSETVCLRPMVRVCLMSMVRVCERQCVSESTNMMSHDVET